MSGIAGVFYRDGRIVEPDLLSRLLSGIAFRGPDAQASLLDGSFGFARALLRTTWEAESEPVIVQMTDVSLVADARIDDRDDLIRELAIEEGPLLSDGELILAAYMRWDEACVEHLKGDFAFAIWDKRKRKLYCARDHFGIKPFYYAETASIFLFSSDVTALRTSGISSELNEQALVDFLAFGHNRVAETTTFKAIRKLPAAHSLTITPEELFLRRYWTFPADGRTRFQHDDDCVERFRELLMNAVENRLRCGRVSIFMSGGLDSTSIAATASRLSGRNGQRTGLEALTSIEERVGEDPEKTYAAAAAQSLGIPLQFLLMDDYQLLDGDASLECNRPEPQNAPFRMAQRDLFARTAQFSRVVLEGSGADPALLATHANQPMSFTLARDAMRAFLPLLLTHRRIPRLGFRTGIRKLRSRPMTSAAEKPAWLRDRVLQDEGFQQRYRALNRSETKGPRAAAHASLSDVYWPAYFERSEATPALYHVELRFPFFDVELLTFVLGLPALPWFVEKHILRRAMKGWLPESVRLRPKTRVVHDQTLARKEEVVRLVETFRPSPVIDSLVDWQSCTGDMAAAGQADLHRMLRVMSLDAWLRAWKLGN